MQIHADCKKWHVIFAYAKAAPLFEAGDFRRYVSATQKQNFTTKGKTWI